MPLLETKGAASSQGFGEFAKVGAANYIEDVFSTWLYVGTGSTQTITNGIDLSTKGGLVWLKSRISSVYDHQLVDTTRGSTKYINSNLTNAESTSTNRVTAFNANGFTLAGGSQVNESTGSYVSWTFRKQPKFFDVVTWTGDGTGNRTISHSLGSVPGCIIVKRTDTTSIWTVFHRSINSGRYGFIRLDSQNAANTSTDFDWNPTSTTFQADNDLELNFNNGTYVAYLFAHNAGGFGLTGTDNVISCGSYTGTGAAGNAVTLGYEPQWVLIKNTSITGDWQLVDVMRGMVNGTGGDFALVPNSSTDEVSWNGASGLTQIAPTATGFILEGGGTFWNNSGNTYIYIAIRRGPMKTPTTGTSVFNPNIWTGTGSTQQITTGFFPDMFIGINRGAIHAKTFATDILRGLAVTLATNVTDAENSESGNTFNMTGYSNNNGNLNSGFGGGQTYVGHFFKRAPGFFDVVCYTGTGSNLTLNHNLGVTPELIITKRRNGATYGAVYASSLGVDQYLELFSSSTGGRSAAQTFSGSWLTPTSTTFGVGVTDQNLSAETYVAYLFSTVIGVSKVGSYTGNGSSQTINCGFTGGARFVLIKRTNAAGDWVVFDSARGIVSGNDPFLELNTTAAEQTGQDAVDTDSTGFVVNETTENLNVNGASYIFLAIA